MKEDVAKGALEQLGSFFRAKEALSAGIPTSQLQTLVRTGRVERVSWGLYQRTDFEPTEHHTLARVCAQVSNSIVCLISALQVHELGTRVPAEVWLAIGHKARPPRVRDVKLRLIRFSGPAWNNGVQPITFEGVQAHVTSPARTVVDCFRFTGRVGHETAREALRDALEQRKVTVDALFRVLDVLPSAELRRTLETM